VHQADEYESIRYRGRELSVKLALGIDTGGTYTDAVIIDYDTGQVMTSAKSLTTRQDLGMGIAAAIQHVLEAAARISPGFSPEHIALVAVSTTLATNILAEGHRATIALILIGYDPKLMTQYGFDREMSTEDIVHVRGGHDLFGEEVVPLDEDAALAAIVARRARVDAFAVSGYFGVRNPAHENRVRALIHELSDLPVTCGHELTSQLNAMRRATTTALNAHLIAPLTELVSSLQRTLGNVGIAAPLMVVKGDGSLVRAEWAMHRPIETILSGPAASLVGAWHLGGRRDVWVVDVGGTTTDIGALRGGAPLLNGQGARVAGWRTMVEAVDVHTVGLGGDSHVRLHQDQDLVMGPRRVVPLCLLAAQHPQIIQELQRQTTLRREKLPEEAGEFLVSLRLVSSPTTELESEILARLAQGPQSIEPLMQESRSRGLLRHAIESLETLGFARRAAFTPTDALHVLGRFRLWNSEAAKLGASLLAARAGLSIDKLCEQVVDGMASRIATELVAKVLTDEVGPPAWEREPLARALVKQAFDGSGIENLECRLSLRQSLVAIGAPASAYMPGVAHRLNTEVLIPPHAEVANAVGAVTGSVVQRTQALISPLGDGDQFRVYLPGGVQDFLTLEEAISHTRKVMLAHVEELASQAGGEQIETHVNQRDFWIPVKGAPTERLYMGSELTFSAVGRPSPARH
jgi:N-methylhydantoinase A/oxoprolinase/acetone carboxylase beta subunit